jgi:hypothetical protein
VRVPRVDLVDRDLRYVRHGVRGPLEARTDEATLVDPLFPYATADLAPARQVGAASAFILLAVACASALRAPCPFVCRVAAIEARTD